MPQMPPVPTFQSLGPSGVFFLLCMIAAGKYVSSPWWMVVLGFGGTGFLSAAWQVFEYWNDRRRGIVRQSRWTKTELSSTRHIAVSVLWFAICGAMIFSGDSSLNPLGVGFLLASVPPGLMWFLIHRYETADERERMARRNVQPPRQPAAPSPKTVNVPPV